MAFLEVSPDEANLLHLAVTSDDGDHEHRRNEIAVALERLGSGQLGDLQDRLAAIAKGWRPPDGEEDWLVPDPGN